MTSSNQYSNISFGLLLTRSRKSLGKTSRQMAEAMKLSPDLYETMENGGSLPDTDQLIIIANILGKDVLEVAGWMTSTADTQPETHQNKSTLYEKEFLEACETIKGTQGLWKYEPLTDKRYDEIFSRLQNDLANLSSVPHLPENIVFLFEVLSQYNDITMLKDCKGFFPKGETLAGYLARSPHIGFFLFYTANCTFFAKQPASNLMDCFNRMSFSQLKELLVAVLSNNGVYTHTKELPYLQQQDEFASLAALMTRELTPHIEKVVNTDHLNLAVMAQNLGEHALFKIFNSWKDLGTIDRNFLYHIVYELHPVVSAHMGKKWGLTEETCDGILNHHSRSFHEDEDPFVDVTPFGAVMKLIAHLTDWGFSPLTENKIKKLSTLFKKTGIPAQVVTTANNNMFLLRQSLIEVSSTILDKAELTGNKTATIVEKMDDDGNMYSAHYLSRNDFRFTPTYQKALVSKAKEHTSRLVQEMFFGEKGSSESFIQKVMRIRESYDNLHGSSKNNQET